MGIAMSGDKDGILQPAALCALLPSLLACRLPSMMSIEQ
ncbi:hypothetical protein D1AOALGA4SA_12805 [Olavius algarvensis Delta 1 endosymbiont]|nr:hypothetical protein D1AOALGA4SA_12805 [Olavius algarvensis Delta 1 endosymbiont]